MTVAVDKNCDHSNADYEDMEFTKTTFWEGMHVPDDSEIREVWVCQRKTCRMWQDFDGTWREQ